MNTPLVSIVMPVYNGEVFLNQAIESILKQSYENFEFIIINDKSNDKSLEIINSYEDGRIIIINNDKREGITRSLNIGIKSSKGEYIARQDADDISHSERLKKQMEFLVKNNDYSLVGTNGIIIDSNNNYIDSLENISNYHKLLLSLCFRNTFIHGSCVFKNNYLYNENITFAQDYELWLRISINAKVSNIAEELYSWRTHNNSISFKYEKQQRSYGSKVKKIYIPKMMGKIQKEIDKKTFEKNIIIETLESVFMSCGFERYNQKNIFSIFKDNLTKKEILFKIKNFVPRKASVRQMLNGSRIAWELVGLRGLLYWITKFKYFFMPIHKDIM